MSPEWQAPAGLRQAGLPRRGNRIGAPSTRQRDADVVTRGWLRLSHCTDFPRADPRCIEEFLHSEVSHFALWLEFLLQLGALKLFDEVLVKQRAAIVRVR